VSRNKLLPFAQHCTNMAIKSANVPNNQPGRFSPPFIPQPLQPEELAGQRKQQPKLIKESATSSPINPHPSAPGYFTLKPTAQTTTPSKPLFNEQLPGVPRDLQTSTLSVVHHSPTSQHAEPHCLPPSQPQRCRGTPASPATTHANVALHNHFRPNPRKRRPTSQSKI